ncbi:TonB-dependent receptor [Dyella solisilvae]|uniref:TonB-dependent receptor n=1 Tax=Dyella solisilvae TaxID=1920168 RepID=A0A370K7M7_9GAMM|nr:TonB-dependent receptor [Dyella solisilvae]RDI98642.1 TonB-dependent receptor [Dyella solisilvae]
MTIRPRPLSVCLRQLLFGGSVLLLGGAPLAAFADDQATAAPQDNTSANTGTQANPDKAKLLGNVTVTAQSRSQEVQSVPIALQIVTAQQIDTLAATDLSKMDIFVPGLNIDASQPTQPTYSIRGISTSNFGIGTESAVGVYVDGVYAARSGGSLLAFNDVARVEVLKGPQGTLFGRNAAAGAISIVTNEPTDKFEGDARIRIGNEGQRYADALVNIPINKDMALRVSVLDNQSDGWIKDAATGQHYGKNDDWGSRIVYRWNFTDNTRMLLSWDHERLNQPPEPAIGLIPLSNDTNERAPFPADPSTYLNPLHAPLYNDAIGAAETRTFNGVTLRIDHSFSWGELQSTTAWRGFDTFNRGDYDGTNHVVTYLDTTNIEHNNSWYQEFKLSGNTDLMDWVGGVSYYQEQARQTSQTNINTDSLDTLAQNVYGVGTPLTEISQAFSALGLPYTLLGDPWHEAISNDGNFKAYAAFGDVIWHITDRFDLTTGLRYTRDEKEFSWYNMPRSAPQFDATVAALKQTGIYGFLPPDAQAVLAAFSGNVIFPTDVGVPAYASNTWNNWSPRVVASYKFTPDVMGYASITKGYKAGGYNSVQIGSTFAPEKVINYEAGIKSVFPEQNVLVNASVYYYRYDNMQSLALDPNSPSSGVPIYVVSSSNQEAKGLDFEVQWQPLENLHFGLVGAYIDSKYRNATAPDGVDLTGQPTGAPYFSGAASVAYTWRNVANGDLRFDLTQGYRGPTRCNDDSRLQGNCVPGLPFPLGTSQQRTDARIGWSSPGDRWGVALYGNNVFNKRYVTGINNISTSVFGTPFASISPPRLWGVELRAKF